MSTSSPQIKVDVPSADGNQTADGGHRGKKHVAKAKSVSSLISSKSSFLPSSQNHLLAVQPASKKTTLTSFKVEAEIVNTDSTKNVSLFDYIDAANLGGASFNDNLSSIINDSSTGVHHSGMDNNTNLNQNSDSEETFVYDTQKLVDSVNMDETRSIAEGERPILIHKNSVRSSFMTNHNNSSQPRAFSQTVLPDNESIVSKKLISQRRIPTLQQPQQPQQPQHKQQPQQQQQQQQPIQLILPSRYASKSAQYQQSISSRSQIHLAVSHSLNDTSDSRTQTNSDDSDEESFISGLFPGSEAEDGDTEAGADDTNTTLKLNKAYVSSPLKSFGDQALLLPDRQLSKSPVRNASTRNMIISQVRNVSKNLFENEKNYSRKRLSFNSLKEDDERSLILHNPNDVSDDEYPFYLNNNNNNNNNNHAKNHPNNNINANNNNDMHGNYSEHWNEYNYNNRYHNRSNNANDDFYYYPTYDSINPHNYVSKYKKQNLVLKTLSLLLRVFIFGMIFLSICKVFIIKYITNPVINFEITNLEKLIIAENLLIFDVDCRCTNMNLQDVIVDESDIDVFITYTNEENIEKTILLGNISNFFVPLKFNGLLNSENVPFSKIFSSSFARNLTMSSKGQLKLNGDFKEVDNIDLIIRKTFFLDIRGSFKYRLPLSSSGELISVSKKYKNKEQSIII